ncbi:type II secretion system major pseudopilin GspG [bacterium]|nr:type II secretion system major pseudopilin GspG [bacterium]
MCNIRFSRPTSRRAFTFLEIMLVVVIIGILLSVVGPRLVGRTQRAQVQATKQQMSSVEQALGLYEMQVGGFPTTEQGLEALIRRPSDVDEDVWEKTWGKSAMPKDSWKQEFEYRYPGEHNEDYDLVSAGPDREFGTSDDITNYTEDEPRL